MAEHDDRQDVPGRESAPARIGRAINILGAVASLALIAGIGVWGYKLVMRDVSGVPVVRALEGPMRVQPEDPGGRPADHQGLAVNAVAANGAAEAPAERLVLAPKPVSLTDEDMPAGQVELAADPVEAALRAAARSVAPPPEAKPGGTATLKAVAQADDLPRPERAIAKFVRPDAATPPSDEAADIDADAEEAVQLAVLAPDVPGLASSLRPAPRPAAFSPRRSAPSAPSRTALDVDPDTLAPGTRLAQLGAYESREVAEAEWQRIAGRFDDYLGDKQRVIQKASSGGRTFYRLRALGFEDINDARRFCAVLVAEDADCIPVTTR